MTQRSVVQLKFILRVFSLYLKGSDLLQLLVATSAGPLLVEMYRQAESRGADSPTQTLPHSEKANTQSVVTRDTHQGPRTRAESFHCDS